MQDLELCAHILGLEAPWVVDEVKVDRPSKRIDIIIGLGSGRRALFRKKANCPHCGRELPAPGELRRMTLRHLNIGDMRTYLTVPCDNVRVSSVLRACVCHKRWGKVGSRFSSEMETQVLDALDLLKSPQQVARLLRVSAAEVREIGEHCGTTVAADSAGEREVPQFNQGGLEVTFIDESAVEPEAAPTPAAVPVPSETHPVWNRIIQGSAVVDGVPVSFKMLLEQIRLSAGANPTEASRRAGVRLLRQYFIKYWRRLRGEMERLLAESSGEGVTAKPAGADGSAIPEEKDNCWQLLIDGKLPLITDAVALKMLLERVRLSLGSQADPAHRLAGARVLRSYFVKYRSRLQKELPQLQAVAGKPMNMTPPAPRRLHVPAETDSCWQRLILGDLDLRTEIVGLTMLLERVRQSLGAAPSEAALLAATRALRQFFVKYGPRLRSEVEQLIRAGTGPVPVLSSGGQVVEFVEVPPENHPSWQRLIAGELELKTDALSLKMLLERIRLTLGPDATEMSRLAAARILRQYFIKYRARHRAELEQLKVA